MLTKTERAAAYLAAMGPAIQGQGGDDHTFKACLVGGDFGLDESDFLPLLEDWNAKCDPPWRTRDLENKLRNAYRNRRKPLGCRVDDQATAHTPEPPRYPPTAEVQRLWESTVALDDPRASDVAAWLESRNIDPATIAAMDLEVSRARVLPTDAKCPAWATHAGRPWAHAWRLLMPLYDHRDRLTSLRARIHGRTDGPKSVSPLGFNTRGLVMAGAWARVLLRVNSGQLPPDGKPLELPTTVVITEGETDWLTGCQAWEHPKESAVFGVVAGAWTTEIASAIPSRATVIIATDNDPAGDKYADAINTTIGHRCQVRRRTNAGS